MFVSSRLSISAAWDRTRARFAADGGLLLTVALALIALPSAIGEFAFPQTKPFAAVGGVAETVTMIVVLILGIVGQLALVKLTLGPALSVGEAIAHGARRTPAFLGSAVILLLGMFILAIPFGMLLAAMGVTVAEGGVQMSGRVALVMLAFLALIIFLGTRLLVSAPVASMEHAGSFAILKRSWQLTSGHFWRLFAFIWLFIIGALVVMLATGTIVNLIVMQLFGNMDPLSAAALISALVVSLVMAGITAMFAVMVSEIYAELAGRDAALVSVPSSGT
jgi:hypothetical protein